MARIRYNLFSGNPPAIAQRLGPIRLLLLRRSLQVLTPLCAAIAVLNGCLGAPIWPSLVATSAAVAGLVWLNQRPEQRAAVAWLTGFAGLGVLWAGHFGAGYVPLPAAVVLPALGVLVEGPVLGLALLAGVCVLLAKLGLPPDLAPVESLRLLVAGATSYVLVGTTTGWTWGLRNTLASTEAAHAALVDTVHRRDALANALFGDAVATQRRLAARLAASTTVDWEGLKGEVEAFVTQTSGFKELRRSLTSAEPAAPDFSAPVLRALLLFFLTVAVPAAFYQVVLGHGPPLPGISLVLICSAGLWAMRGSRRAPAWVGWAWVAAGFATLLYDVLRDRGILLTPTLVGWCSCALQAALLVNRRAALVMGAIAVLATLDAGLALGPRADIWREIGSHIFAQSVTVLVVFQAVDGQRRVLTELEFERMELASGLAQQRRYLGTLFHDIANPLGALLLLCHVGVDGDADDEDQARARRLAERLGLLLADCRSWLLEKSPPSTERPDAIELLRLVEELRDVFHERLSSKDLSVTTEVPAGLSVRGRATALRESVIANLLSNAIKFSAPGSSLELRAWQDSERVHLELADRGPGLPAGLLQALQLGADLPSRAGTAGEPGQGLGLALAQEHVQRMGGELTLLDRPGGGLIARVTLDAA